MGKQDEKVGGEEEGEEGRVERIWRGEEEKEREGKGRGGKEWRK